MKDYGGYFFNIDEENRVDVVIKHIDLTGTFTDAISSSDWENKKTEIFLISFQGKISYAALAHKGGRILTGKNRIRFTNFVPITPEIPVQFLENEIQTNLKQYFIRASKGVGKKTPLHTWSVAIDFIKRLRPQAAAQIDELYKLKNEDFVINGKDIKTLAEEKDAANIALRIAGFDKTEVLNMSPPQPAERITAFIETFKNFSIIEDRMIEHDTRFFGSWSQLNPYMIGAVEFEKDGEKLLIINANRGNIEYSMGVDLIYYFEKFDSYLLIQYKRMDESSGEPTYRPLDKSYKQEMERLKFLKKQQQQLPFSQNGIIRDYRLNQESIYFKLCPKTIFNPSSTEMIPGMYIPFDYWEELLKSSSVQGPRGGLQITYKNVERHISNSLFIDLAQSGWIGSKSMTSNQIYQYVRSALEGNRSITFAVDKTSIKKKRRY